MDFNIEDYRIIISQYDEKLVEVDILKDNKFITGTFTDTILNVSDRIKKIIKDYELNKYGYCRFNIDNYK